MIAKRYLSVLSILSVITILLSLSLFLQSCALSPSFSEELDCRQCHSRLAKGKAHKPVTEGCKTCHTALNAENVPHKMSNKIEKGLFAAQPDLCFQCHDQSKFSKKTVHAAVSSGCTSCHNPHTSKNPRLLVSAPPDLCYGCHDKSLFTKKTVHPALDMGCTVCHNPHSAENEKLTLSAVPELCYTCHDQAAFNKKNVHNPVAQGMCLTCHGPHSSDSAALLNKGADDLCLDCHAEMARKPHGTKAAAGKDGTPGTGKSQGPKKTCVGCHTPHSADSKNLLRPRQDRQDASI